MGKDRVMGDKAPRPYITLTGDKIEIDVGQRDFYETMLKAIVERVFHLLGPEFDKQAFLDEVKRGRSAVEIGQELAIPVSIMLSLELGYCLGQLKGLDRSLDCDKALKDLYAMWKGQLRKMLRTEMMTGSSVH